MKKNLLFLFALICSMSLFTACNNDDDQPDYTGSYAGDALELSVSGVKMTSSEVAVNGNILTLKNVVPGLATVDVPLTVNGTEIEGTNSISNGSVSVKGSVKDAVAATKAGVTGKVMALEVSIKYTGNEVGTWNLLPYTQDGDVLTSSPILVEAESASGTVPFFGMEQPVAAFQSFLSGILGAYAQEIKSITLREDGFIVATYADSKKGDTPVGLVQYYIKDNMIYVIPNLSMIGEIMPTSRAINLGEIMEMLSNGLPLIYSVDNGNLKVYVTKEMIAPYLTLIEELLPLLPAENELVMMLNMYFPSVKGAIDSCSKFNMGLLMKK